MAKKKVTLEKSAVQVATELLEIRAELNQIKNIEKALSLDLKKRMKMGETQDYFRLIPAVTMRVVDAVKALAWASKYAPSVITVNAVQARQVFLGDIATGSMGSVEANGFQFKETETLREIRSGEIATEEATIEA